jgi:ABC-type sugar transport system permease subunit
MASKSVSLDHFEAYRRRAGILLVSPALAMILLTAIVPLAVAFALSFTSYNMFTPPRFVGLTNYQQLFADPVFW